MAMSCLKRPVNFCFKNQSSTEKVQKLVSDIQINQNPFISYENDSK